MPYVPTKDAGPTDLEARAGIESLEGLHAERREIIKRLAPLALLYGSGGDRADAKRKQHRAIVGELLRKELEGGADISQTRIEAMANSDKRHLDFCDDLDKQFIDYHHWQTAYLEINERIASREYEARYLTAELRLQPG